MIPGCAFFVDENKPSSYIRVAFSLASTEQIELVKACTVI